MNFVRGGRYFYSAGQPYNRGPDAYYWSSTVVSSVDSRNFCLDPSEFLPQYTYSKGFGFSVHCVIRIIPISSTSPSVIVENAPLNFVRNGWYQWSNGQLGNNGTGGFYLSTTTANSTMPNQFAFITAAFNPKDANAKGFGLSVRCIKI